MSENDPSPQAGSEVPLEHAKELGEALAHIDVLRASHEALATAVGASNTVINDIGTRMDALVQAQKETAEELAKLKPVAAAGEEIEGGENAIAGTDPPAGTAQIAEKESQSPLAGFHKVFG